MNFLKKNLFLIFLTLSFFACKKQPGLGGLATIKGKIFATDVTASGSVRDSGFLGNQTVFISAAGDTYSFDNVKTSYDGSFEFKFLQKGDYDIWTFSNCDTCTWKQKKVLIPNINISGRTETVDMGVVKIII
jgi:hypothetical protein